MSPHFLLKGMTCMLSDLKGGARYNGQPVVLDESQSKDDDRLTVKVGADYGATFREKQENLTKICSCCFAERKKGLENMNTTKLWKCYNCTVSHYCSEECQKKHWKEGHREKCSVHIYEA